MIRFFLRIGWWAESHTIKLSREGIGIIGKIFFRIVKFLCIAFIQLICFIKYKLLKINPQPLSYDKERPIISLTTFPARINTIWLVLLSMFYQTYRPSKILLILTQEEFPEGKSSLPESVRRMEKLGVEIIFQPFNLKPHNKYYYALSHVKDQNVITIDDDLFYWSNTIELLMNMHKKYPICICANKALKIINKDNEILYDVPMPNSGGHSLMAQGVCGVLYPSLCYRPEMFDKDKIKSLCLGNDDNWLKVQEILAGIKVITGEYYPHPLVIMKSQRIALWHKNISGKSLMITKQLLKHYQIDIKE